MSLTEKQCDRMRNNPFRELNSRLREMLSEITDDSDVDIQLAGYCINTGHEMSGKIRTQNYVATIHITKKV